jgi:FAD dependent oxidoreductase
MIQTRPTETFDVVVIGGGSAGVAAAAGAARYGAKTLLVERYGFLGGAATAAGVLAYCGLHLCGVETAVSAVHGVADDVLGHLRDLGVDSPPRRSVATGNWVTPLNPEALKIALDRTAVRAGAEVTLHTSLIDVALNSGVIEAVRLADHSGHRTVTARAWIDASGECNLAAMSGAAASPRFGVNRKSAPASYPVRISGIAGSLELDRVAIQTAACTIEAHLGRATVRQTGGFITRLPGTDDLWWLVVDLVTDGLSGPDMSAAERDGRELVWQAVAALRSQVPGFERASIATTGPQLGIRETRHVASRDDVLEADAASGRLRPDGIARAAWPMEIHHAPGRTEYRPIGGAGYFHVPLGALRAAHADNLWLAGRTVGADPAAFASVRVMGTAFATGHAAGIAAALQAQSTGATAVDAEHVIRKLRAQNALI